MEFYLIRHAVNGVGTMTEKITYDNWDNQLSHEINQTFTDCMDVLKWAYQLYGSEVIYSCSFGAEGMVLIDLIHKVKSCATIIFLDTDLHFKETYELIDQVKQKYPTLNIQLIKPSLTLSEQVEEHGDILWERSPGLCCHIRKIRPLQEGLEGTQAWITGLRRESSPTRQHFNYINKDEKFKKIKICPLIDWTWEDVWSYIKLNNLPYNELHDKGYPSIGCEMCTLPAKDPKNERSGRWDGFEKTECGLH